MWIVSCNTIRGEYKIHKSPSDIHSLIQLARLPRSATLYRSCSARSNRNEYVSSISYSFDSLIGQMNSYSFLHSIPALNQYNKKKMKNKNFWIRRIYYYISKFYTSVKFVIELSNSDTRWDIQFLIICLCVGTLRILGVSKEDFRDSTCNCNSAIVIDVNDTNRESHM